MKIDPKILVAISDCVRMADDLKTVADWLEHNAECGKPLAAEADWLTNLRKRLDEVITTVNEQR